MLDLITAINSNGGAIHPLEIPGHLPVCVAGRGLLGGDVTVAANVSSQFTSALLMVAPYARTYVVLLYFYIQWLSKTEHTYIFSSIFYHFPIMHDICSHGLDH
jgi:5-enolpyruvylshikimate-3-phosphate synthase